MHAGSLTGDTKAAQVYYLLKEGNGYWFSNVAIADYCQTPCVSTRISEVRRQLPPGERLEVMRRQENGEPRWYYRIVRVA